MNQSGSLFGRFDFTLLGAVLILVVFGVMVIASATQDAIDPELISRVPDQIRFAAFGFVALFAMAFIDYRTLGGLNFWLYSALIGMLVMVIFFGTEGDGGARRWINVGILIQPSEVGKIIIIITLSTFFTRNYARMDKLSTVFKSIIHMGIPIGLIFIQPDLGTSIVYIVIWATITWAAGLRIRHIVILGLLALAALPIAFTQLEPYQIERFTTFLAPESDPDAQYNIDQALISIGSGGLLGKGYTTGSQNQGRFLRVRHTDFIFSVIAHEFGMVGGIATMSLIGLVIFRILRGARLASDALGSMICYGVAGMIFFQTVVSIGMNLNLMPVTGLTLPFVSSGGTSLLFTLVGIGLVESVIMRRRRLDV